MKKIFLSIAFASSLILSLQSCQSQKVVVNREVDSQKDGKMLLDYQNKEQFTKAPYNDWYQKEHDEYVTDKKAISELKKEKINSYNILVFMGTWCEDSHRDFPRLMKILEEVNYPEGRLSIIAVNRKKESPSGEESKFNIQKVPTIIVEKYGKEIGRIIESPKTGYIERDLVDILKKDNVSVFKELFKKDK